MYAYRIKSDKFSNDTNYIVVTDDEKLASEMIQKEVDCYGWTWGGTPTITQLSTKEMKELKNANLIWG